MWNQRRILAEQAEEERKRQEDELNGRKEPVKVVTYLPKISIWAEIARNRMCHGILILFIISIVLPTVLFGFLYAHDELDDSNTCVITPEYQIPCGVNGYKSTFEECKAIKCCFNDSTSACFHTLPSKYQYRSSDNNLKNGFVATAPETPFGGKSSPKVYLSFDDTSETQFTITLSETPIATKRNIELLNKKYQGIIYTTEMGVEVRRQNSTNILLTTTHGPAIISNRYWEWTMDLHTQNLYGLNQLRFEDNKTTTKVIYSNAIEHGLVPKFMAESNGVFHGLAIDHTGPLEISVLPSKIIVIRMLSGHVLTVHLSVGPTPVDVLKQQRRYEPSVPPFWALGVHICRDGQILSIPAALKEFNDFHYKSTNMMAYDSDCLHENMFSLTMNVTQEEEKKIAEALKILKSSGKKFMMSLSPQILVGEFPAYKEAIKKGIVYMESNVSTVQGSYQGQIVSYPDFRSTEARAWVKESLNNLYKKINTEADAFVLRDNWPVNEIFEMNNTGEFQYFTEDLRKAMSKTLPWNSKSPSTSEEHVLRHNKYGSEHAIAIKETKQDAFLLSASYDSDYQNGAHVQNVNISWVNFKRMLTETLSHSLFSSSMHSSPICGSTSLYTEQNHISVCLRWYIAAATLPVFRISSDLPRRDPVSIKSGHLETAALTAIRTRYMLLPYYFSVLQERLPLIRPMFFDFYADNNTLILDEQYMLGIALLVVQPVLAQTTIMNVYLPKIPYGWYEFWGGSQYDKFGWTKMPVVEMDLVMFIAAGQIIPLQNDIDIETVETAEKSRLSPVSLAVALDCTAAPICTASGQWTVSNTINLVFTATEDTLHISNIQNASLLLCSDNPTVTNTIKALRIYFREEIQIYETNLELCKVSGDSTAISYTI